MANNLSFDDVAKNLLVFLKGQVPLLENISNKDEVLKQIQIITLTLRATIVQLEGATPTPSSNSTDQSYYIQQIEELKAQNVQLEDILNTEKNTNRELRQKLVSNAITDLSDDDRSTFEDIFHKQLIENEQLRKDNQKLKTESERYKVEYEKYREEHDKLKLKIENDSLLPKIDESVVDNLKAEISDLENSLTESESKVATLKQAIQNKDIEINKSKEAILDAINHEKAELDKYRTKLDNLESVKVENALLQKQVSDLQKEIDSFPNKDEYKTNIVSMSTKIKFLEDSLFTSQTELKKAQEMLSHDKHNELVKENEDLQEKIKNLEGTLNNLITDKENEIISSKKAFLFNPDECIFLFETLTATVRRLKESLENKDIFLRSKESITILEKTKAISKIQTVGHHLDLRLHKVNKAFLADFLPDETIIFEESSGFVSGNKLIQKAVVWVTKSKFVCTECGKESKPFEMFCPQCGYELTAPDGTTKRDMPEYPTSLEVNLPLLDELMKQGNVKASTKIMSIISKISPNDPEVVKKQAILSRVDPSFSLYPDIRA